MNAPPASEATRLRCPCLSGLTFAECCQPIHRLVTDAPTAERLMRSRYSAFAVGDTAYLLRSWHSRTRPSTLELDPAQRWYRLDILANNRGGLLDTEGTVEFRAYSKVDPVPPAPAHRAEQHEVSYFARENHRWVYVGEA